MNDTAYIMPDSKTTSLISDLERALAYARMIEKAEANGRSMYRQAIELPGLKGHYMNRVRIMRGISQRLRRAITPILNKLSI